MTDMSRAVPPEVRPDPSPAGDAQDRPNGAALHSAIASGAPERVKSLIEAGIDLYARNAEDLTPLHQAVILGQPEIVKILLEAGVDQRVVDRYTGWTPLHYATIDGMEDSVKILLSHDAGQRQADDPHQNRTETGG